MLCVSASAGVRGDRAEPAVMSTVLVHQAGFLTGRDALQEPTVHVSGGLGGSCPARCERGALAKGAVFEQHKGDEHVHRDWPVTDGPQHHHTGIRALGHDIIDCHAVI